MSEQHSGSSRPGGQPSWATVVVLILSIANMIVNQFHWTISAGPVLGQ